MIGGNAKADPILDQRPRHAAAQFPQVMLGRHAFDEALDARQRRTPRDDVDQPGRRIGAEQRSLRTAQDLDALDIGKLARRRATAGQEYAVEEYADRRLLAGIVLLRRHAAQHASPSARLAIFLGRSEERRVGKRRFLTWRYRV